MPRLCQSIHIPFIHAIRCNDPRANCFFAFLEHVNAPTRCNVSSIIIIIIVIIHNNILYNMPILADCWFATKYDPGKKLITICYIIHQHIRKYDVKQKFDNVKMWKWENVTVRMIDSTCFEMSRKKNVMWKYSQNNIPRAHTHTHTYRQWKPSVWCRNIRHTSESGRINHIRALYAQVLSCIRGNNNNCTLHLPKKCRRYETLRL